MCSAVKYTVGLREATFSGQGESILHVASSSRLAGYLWEHLGEEEVVEAVENHMRLRLIPFLPSE